MIPTFALLSFYFIERPALRFRKWLQQSRSSKVLIPLAVSPEVAE
jgi:hypothetical protein